MSQALNSFSTANPDALGIDYVLAAYGHEAADFARQQQAEAQAHGTPAEVDYWRRIGEGAQRWLAAARASAPVAQPANDRCDDNVIPFPVAC